MTEEEKHQAVSEVRDHIIALLDERNLFYQDWRHFPSQIQVPVSREIENLIRDLLEKVCG